MTDTTTAAAPGGGQIQRASMDMLRSVLVGVGTPLIAKGVIDNNALTAIVGGLVALASAIWSWIAAHPSKTSPLVMLQRFVRAAGARQAWNADAAMMAAALYPIIEKIVDQQIRARAGILAGPLETAANAAVKAGLAQAETAVAIPPEKT